VAIDTRDRLIRDGRFPPESKMIVRGASEESVLELFQAFVELLKGRNDGVIAMHNNFGLVGNPGCQQALMCHRIFEDDRKSFWFISTC
jgi:hypothetical protein